MRVLNGASDVGNVRAPCDAPAALRALDTLVLQSAPREDFVRQYARRDIMQRMAADIAAHLPPERER